MGLPPMEWLAQPSSSETHNRFVKDFGLYRLLGTIQYSGGVHAT